MQCLNNEQPGESESEEETENEMGERSGGSNAATLQVREDAVCERLARLFNFSKLRFNKKVNRGI